MPDNIRKPAERFMRERLDARHLYWETRGPRQTAVQWLQCWGLPDGRMIVVEVYHEGGFDVFPVVRCAGLEATKRVIDGMDALERRADDDAAQAVRHA